MRKHLSTALALFLLATSAAACTTLSPEDRKMLTEAHDMAQQAKDEAIKAEDLAREAEANAAKSAQAAQDASKRADRIFREGQNK